MFCITAILFFLYFANTSGYSLNRLTMMDDLSTIKRYGNFFVKQPVSQLYQDITNHKLSNLIVNKEYNKIYSVLSDSPQDDVFLKYHITNIDPIIAQPIMNAAIENNIDTVTVDLTPSSFLALQGVFHVIGDIVNVAFPLFILGLILQSIFAATRNNNPLGIPKSSMNIRTPGQGGLNFLNNNKDAFNKEVLFPNVSLSSWAGSPEVLEECKEVIAYLENKESFQTLGATMPKGILLEGPPGTGKTLLAKGIASETNASFISMAGSEFVELFVGMGASRVRELFDNARENKPCVIFIDEIDAVGRQRGAGINMANDEREQTLNQILYEMDGFNNNDDILVLAATNRKDVLDQALLRPGRFDRIIRVPLPDKFSRGKILDFYLQSKPVEKTIDVNGLAEITDGFSGAQLKNLVNEAAIMSAKKKSPVILEQDLFNSFEKLIVGIIKTNNSASINTKTRVAVHESGHALLTMLFHEYFQLQKVSIQPTYNGAGGYTLFTEMPEIKEGGLYTKDILKKRLIVTLGGKAAENIYYGEDFVSLGAVQDLQQANKLAQRMIGNFGMGKALEVFFNENINDESNPFLGRGLSVGSKYSENTMKLMDRESLALVVEAYQSAKIFLTEHKDILLEMSELLKEKTVLNPLDFQSLKERLHSKTDTLQI